MTLLFSNRNDPQYEKQLNELLRVEDCEGEIIFRKNMPCHPENFKFPELSITRTRKETRDWEVLKKKAKWRS